MTNMQTAAHAFVQRDLDARNTVLISTDATGSREGWWRIDPATGTTLFMLDTGGGATMAEYLVMAKRASLAFAFGYAFCAVFYAGAEVFLAMNCVGSFDPKGELGG